MMVDKSWRLVALSFLRWRIGHALHAREVNVDCGVQVEIQIDVCHLLLRQRLVVLRNVWSWLGLDAISGERNRISATLNRWCCKGALLIANHHLQVLVEKVLTC